MCLSFFQGNMECCEPCCGKPCNTNDGIYCCLSFFPGCFCVGPKVYAASQDQACAFVNHCIPFLALLVAIVPIVGGILAFILWCFIRTGIRFNLRKKHGIGDTSKWHMCDCCGIWFIIPAPCFSCQELRSCQKEHWDWYAAFNDKKFPAETQIDPCYMFCVE